MQACIGMFIAGIAQQTDIGQNDGINTDCNRIIDGLMPDIFGTGLRIGVAGQIDMHAMSMCEM